jgi:flagellar protein FlaG
MSADTFTTAMFLITAVIAAGVLISAIFPVFYQMTGTFSSAGHTADVNLRTNIQIIKDYATTTTGIGYVRVWMKNTGSERIAVADIQRSNVICGDAGNFNLLGFTSGTLVDGYWTNSTPINWNNYNYWDPGETLEIDAITHTINQSNPVYFQFSLPNGFSISDQFPVTNNF